MSHSNCLNILLEFFLANTIQPQLCNMLQTTTLISTQAIQFWAILECQLCGVSVLWCTFINPNKLKGSNCQSNEDKVELSLSVTYLRFYGFIVPLKSAQLLYSTPYYYKLYKQQSLETTGLSATPSRLTEYCKLK